jgi:uncharacterized protein (DUF427 family)
VAQLALEPVTFRVRLIALAGRTVADSRAALLVLSDDAPPAYAVPERDVDPQALAAGHWMPIPAAPGYVTLRPQQVEGILEEDEPVLGHPRSPYHRVDAIASSRCIRVELQGVTLAESARPLAVFETDEPTRFYLPQADVRLDLLEPSETTTLSPYLGQAVWFSSRAGCGLHPDIAWTYRFPVAQMPRIAGLLAFRDDLVREL